MYSGNMYSLKGNTKSEPFPIRFTTGGYINLCLIHLRQTTFHTLKWKLKSYFFTAIIVDLYVVAGALLLSLVAYSKSSGNPVQCLCMQKGQRDEKNKVHKDLVKFSHSRHFYDCICNIN